MLAGWAASAGVQAIGVGTAPGSVTLGRAFEVTLPLRLDTGETLEPGCIDAEANFGERRIAAPQLRWRIEAGAGPGERLLHLAAPIAVDEPVITMQVSAGCGTRVTRRFTLFADPPAAVPPAVVLPPSSLPTATAAPPPAAAAPTPTPTPTPTTAARGDGPDVRVPRTPARRHALAERPQRPRAARPARAAAPTPAQPARAAARPARAAAPQARLQLEAPDPELIQRAVAAALAEQQASAAAAVAANASAAAAAASTAGARIQALEAQVAGLQAEARQQQEQVRLLRARAAAADAAERWLPVLVAAIALLVLLSTWLGVRLRDARRAAQERWWDDAAAVLADARPDPVPAPSGAPPRGADASRHGAPGRAVSAARPPHRLASPADRALDAELPQQADPPLQDDGAAARWPTPPVSRLESRDDAPPGPRCRRATSTPRN
jgi:hypothetical protein